MKQRYKKDTCQLYDIIRKIFEFKTGNDDLTTCSVYKYCQRRFFNLQIGIKYRDFRKVKQDYLSQFALLKNSTSDDLFKYLKEVIIYISISLLQEKEYKINRKLHSYVQPIKTKRPVDRKIVNNLSSRVLSNEKTHCIANGLEFGLFASRLDDMNVISNIE
ncbi:unnamed protein product [Adineta steineri]|uniref:Uncharacterized protein n=1 Tax=Adineta steineri TaxID=433720 RepID=A0A814SNH4_9BILA|nr:unnamed protein product [Adineta steineri]